MQICSRNQLLDKVDKLNHDDFDINEHDQKNTLKNKEVSIKINKLKILLVNIYVLYQKNDYLH